MKKNNLIILFIILFLLFLGASADFDLAQFSDDLKISADKNYTIASMTYIFANIVSTVIAPLTVLPLIPIASNIFGPFSSGVFSIIGWTLGAIIAFLIARHAGKPLLSKFASVEKIEKFEKYVPEHVHFFTILVLRMLLPVDALSYALGFFSGIGFWKYSVATLIGVTPFSFVFAYAGGAIPLENYLRFASWFIFAIIILWLIVHLVNKRLHKYDSQ